jgi:hypothetical protein
MAVLTVIGIFIAYKIPISLNERDSADRLTAERTARIEADVGQVNQLVAGVLGEEGSEHAAPKRAAARAIAEYAQQSRIYPPATSILLDYLEKESDPKTHCYLHAAIDRGLTVKPPAGAQSGEGNSLDIATERARLKADTKPTDIADCSAVLEAPPAPGGPGAGARTTTPPHPAAQLQPRVSEWRQYLDVDCARTNTNANGGLFVPVDNALTAQYTVQSATAQIVDASNIKDIQATVVNIQPNGATVRYAMSGLDRQFLGNCPGGGHGTLVVRFQLVPK